MYMYLYGFYVKKTTHNYLYFNWDLKRCFNTTFFLFSDFKMSDKL